MTHELAFRRPGRERGSYRAVIALIALGLEAVEHE